MSFAIFLEMDIPILAIFVQISKVIPLKNEYLGWKLKLLKFLGNQPIRKDF